MIGRLEHRDHLERHILHARPLDRPRRPHPARIPIQQQGDHHRRVIRPPADPVSAIRAIERAQIHARDRVQHEPREVPLRQPIPHIRRQQKRLIPITTNEVLSHPGMVLNPPDDTVITRHPLADAITSYATVRRRKESSGRPVAGVCSTSIPVVRGPWLLRTASACRPGSWWLLPRGSGRALRTALPRCSSRPCIGQAGARTTDPAAGPSGAELSQ